MPPSLVGPNAALVPTPAVSYHYFLSVINQFKLRFKDLSVDQCATRNLHRAKLVRASEEGMPELARVWKQHKLQADKGYVHRHGVKRSALLFGKVLRLERHDL